PSEGRYHPCPGPARPSRCSDTAATSHIDRSVTGKASAHRLHRRTASKASSAARAAPSWAVAVVVQPELVDASETVIPVAMRTPPTISSQPVAARNPPTTKYGMNRQYDPRRKAPMPNSSAPE